MTGKNPSDEKETAVFKSVDDYLRHYGTKKDKEANQNEWYELGAEAARTAILRAENSNTKSPKFASAITRNLKPVSEIQPTAPKPQRSRGVKSRAKR